MAEQPLRRGKTDGRLMIYIGRAGLMNASHMLRTVSEGEGDIYLFVKAEV